MQWRDQGILLWVRRHGETSVVIEVLTPDRGRHAGLVRGGGGKTQGPVLQPGAQLSLEWNARLADHLGIFRVDLIRARAAAIMADRTALAGLNAVSALLVRLLPEREPNAEVYAATLALVDALAEGDRRWPVRYAAWELSLLAALGFGLDLGSCASTGTREDLAYVSPRSGRAVCRAAGAPYAERLLPLPRFLLGGGRSQKAAGVAAHPACGSSPARADVCAALRLTGYFLQNWVCPAFDLAAVPEARMRLARLLDGSEGGSSSRAPTSDAAAVQKAASLRAAAAR
jgi:DNA repair protein RecO (recombination protein O)